MSIIGVLLAVLIVCVAIWATQKLCAAFSVPEPLATVLLVVVVLVCLLWFLGSTRIFSGFHL
jgi:hypothetical protein